MKKILVAIVIILLAAGVYNNWAKIKSLVSKGPQLAQTVASSQVVQDLKQQVINGGALRSSDNAPDAFLTRVGTIFFTNMARQDNGGLPALTENTKLDQDAEAKLKDMFARQYFEHVSPDGKGPSDQAKAAGYQYVVIGENLALGNFKNDQALVDAWMNSPGHRANILNTKYLEIGVAVGQGEFEGHQTWLAVQEFGRPASACPAIDANLKASIDSLKSDVDAITPQLQSLKQQMDSSPQPQNQQQADDYNKLVAQYNALVNIYNNKVDQLKQDTAQYNAQVQAFNACAA